jgi:hypothetical protein
MNPEQQSKKTLEAWQDSARYWEKYRALITQMFVPAFSRLPANCVLFEISVHGAAYSGIEVAETFK